MIDDYCGYCGGDFTRKPSEPPEICKECLSDPEVAATYAEDSSYDAAEKAHDADHRREFKRFYA